MLVTILIDHQLWITITGWKQAVSVDHTGNSLFFQREAKFDLLAGLDY